jgi:hypothetical protein
MWYFYTVEFYWATKKNEILPSTSKCMELENFILVKLTRLRRPKTIYSPLYADYRPKTNAAILLDMGYPLREESAQEE